MKLKIQISNNDKNIPVHITSINNILGYDDDVQTLVNGETNSSINNTDDLEVKRFVPVLNKSQVMRFYFWNGTAYVLNLAPLDFASNNISHLSTEARNSFFILQVFDSYNESTQKKLHTGYYNGYDFLNTINGLSTDYSINNHRTEFFDIYLTNSFIDKITGSTIDVYVKFFFYSGQSGKLYPFSKSNPIGPTTQEGVYLKLTLNKLTFTYTIGVLESYEIFNPSYSTLVNDTVKSTPVESPVYPLGNTFKNDGNYVTN